MEGGGFLKCRVAVYGNSPHVYQVVAGFALLGARDEIDVTFDVRPAADSPYGSPHIVTARIGGDLTVAYDMLDGYNLAPESIEAAAGSVDLYFKRSFDHEKNAALEHRDRMRPFGLSYPVTVRSAVFRRMARQDGLVRRAGRVVRRLLGRAANPSVESFEAPPVVRDHPRVVFMTGVYDPRGEPGEDRAALERDGLAAEREELNALRVGCIRSLRAALGDAFVGGVVPTEFARAAYPDCVLDPADVARPRFLKILEGADVGVATTGLHRSNQWKLAEYMAASKAVVSQPLRYEVPALNASEHYLRFETPEACVDRASALLGDPERRLAMARANQEYYRTYVRPDAAVRRTLRIALQPAEDVRIDVTSRTVDLARERARTWP